MPDRRRPDDYDPDRWDAPLIRFRDGPRELEPGVHRRTLASRNDGWLARGGLLRLHDDGLAFTPAPLERMLLARALRIGFAELVRVERHPERAEMVLPGGRAPRMRLVTALRAFDFVFHAGLDDWIESVEDRRRIWEVRQRFE